jgi:L-fuculose-phosphate aldolase
MASTDLQKLREDICTIAGMMYAKELLCGPAGNISARIDDERILMTPSAYFKQRLAPEQLIVVNMQGKKVEPITDASRDLGPTSEVPMHLAIYRERPDVRGVVHGHPSHCVALTVAGKEIRSQVLTEAMLFLGKVGIADYATPTTAELGDAVGRVVRKTDAVVLPYHGVIVAGKDVWDACAKIEVLEQAAQINCLVNQMGGEIPLAAENVRRMMELREKMGMSLPGDAELV